MALHGLTFDTSTVLFTHDVERKIFQAGLGSEREVKPWGNSNL